MATTALQVTPFSIVNTYIVAAGQVATVGRAVKFAAADEQVQLAGSANDKGIGIALHSAVAGASVQVLMLAHSIVPVRVGTGGATRGEYAVLASDGYINQTLGGGSTVRYIGGVFTQSGVVGDFVGLAVGAFAAGSA